MDSYELRSEIISSGVKYYLQSNLVPSQRAVVTALFHEGKLLSQQSTPFDVSLAKEEQRAFVRGTHDECKLRITSLLSIREHLKKDVDGRAHMKLAEALYNQRLLKEAMAEVIRGIKLGREDSRGYSILGNCLLAIGDDEKAQKAFLKGIDISPDYPDLHNDLGVTYLKRGRCADAVRAFERALELNRYYQVALLNLAMALAQNVVLKQDYDLSRNVKKRLLDNLKMNLQLKPSLDTEEFHQVMVAVEQDRYDQVYEKLSLIKEGLDRQVQANISLELYLILKFRGDEISDSEIDGFIQRTLDALETNPSYADLQNDLGILYTAKCKHFIDKATMSFQQALKLNSEFASAEKNYKLATNDRQGIHFLLRALLD